LCTAQAASLSDEEIIIKSWEGQKAEELLATWGKSPDMRYYPDHDTYEFIYQHKRTQYIPATETRYKDRNGVEKVIRHESETKVYSCEVHFNADKNKRIYAATSYGNACAEHEAVPEHISSTWLATAKEKTIQITAFTTKEAKYGTQVASIRQDSNAYMAGLRKGDYLENNTQYVNKQGELQKESYTVNRKLGFFSKEFDHYVFTFAPTYHSIAYEMMTKRQRALWNVNQ
jgi:hypothetical protein